MNNPEWLEPVLKRSLGRVKAPEELWDRVMLPRVSQRGRTGLRFVWALAASLLVGVVALWGFHARIGPAADEGVAMRSDRPNEIGAWVKARTGLDIPFPEELSRQVRLSGACTIKGSGGAARIAYRVADHDASLVVSKRVGATADRRHHFLSDTSWVMRGETYTLAYAGPGDGRVACMLCHSDVERIGTLN